MVRPKRYSSNDTLLALRSAILLPANSVFLALRCNSATSALHGPLPMRRAISDHERPDSTLNRARRCGKSPGKTWGLRLYCLRCRGIEPVLQSQRWRSLPTGASRRCGNRGTDETGALPPAPVRSQGMRGPVRAGPTPAPGHPCVRAICVGRGPGRRRSAQGVPPVHRGYDEGSSVVISSQFDFLPSPAEFTAATR